MNALGEDVLGARLGRGLAGRWDDAGRAVPPVGAVVQGARRRRNRRRLATSVVAVMALAGTGVAGLSWADGASRPPATADASSGVELAGEAVHRLAPAYVPDGLTLGYAMVQGQYPATVEAGFWLALLRPADGGGDPTGPALLVTVTDPDRAGAVVGEGATTLDLGRGRLAKVTVAPDGSPVLRWEEDGRSVSVYGRALSADELEASAASVRLGGDATTVVERPPDGFAVHDEGPLAGSLEVAMQWFSEDSSRTLDVMLTPLSPAEAAWQTFHAGPTAPDTASVTLPDGREALHYRADGAEALILELDGVKVTVSGGHLGDGELERVTGSLRQLDAGSWSTLLAEAGVEDRLEIGGTPPVAMSSPATTAAAVVAGGERGQDLAPADAVAPGTLYKVPAGSPFSPVISRSASGDLLGLWPYIGTPAGGCMATLLPEPGDDGAVFEAGCTGGRFALDGACLNDRCGQSLGRFEVTERDGRLWGDPSVLTSVPRS